MPTLSFNPSEAEIEVLKYERYLYPEPMIQKRIQAVYIKSLMDFSNEIIGQIVGLHTNTVSHWLRVYSEEGFEGLLTNNYGTNQSELDRHGESLLSSFLKTPPMNAAEAAERIEEMTGIKRSTQQVRAFMKRHGLKFLQCGHIPAKADNEAQHNWVETELKPAIEAAEKKEIHLFFMDAAHFVLQPFLCSLWCACRVFIKGAAGRNRINVLGAMNAITKEVTTMNNATYINANTLIEFLKLLRAKYRDKPIAIVLDNARYQHCYVVKTFARSIGIHLLFLPPYSPNLNIIERLWKFTKKKILYAKYYDKPAEFHLAIQTFFENINQEYQKELKRLLTLKFQFFDQKNPLIYPL
ncbi:MAG: IS630 family transposase [Chitinophagaceae bacterium]